MCACLLARPCCSRAPCPATLHTRCSALRTTPQAEAGKVQCATAKQYLEYVRNRQVGGRRGGLVGAGASLRPWGGKEGGPRAPCSGCTGLHAQQPLQHMRPAALPPNTPTPAGRHLQAAGRRAARAGAARPSAGRQAGGLVGAAARRAVQRIPRRPGKQPQPRALTTHPHHACTRSSSWSAGRGASAYTRAGAAQDGQLRRRVARAGGPPGAGPPAQAAADR